MLFADVVIMSYQLMKNPQYFHIGHALKTHIKNGDERLRQNWVNAQLKVCSIFEKIKTIEDKKKKV